MCVLDRNRAKHGGAKANPWYWVAPYNSFFQNKVKLNSKEIQGDLDGWSSPGCISSVSNISIQTITNLFASVHVKLALF